ncbi:RtcB family protein [Actinoplanes italicus]|uniref:RNA ligase RtcB family protein n=1 Tax=Actinoplanes italicus TaxID=113567 RepID=UPI000D05DC33|nr:RNA ligase RtcB family protein [Actinoplanes italicus]GIE34348.1 RtcB family protein [Actinoplanes italicus]
MSQQQTASTTSRATVRVFAAPDSWIESDAVDQCHQVAALDGMTHVAGMPDLHPGKGAPIGAAMLSSVLYPLLVGSDIGCGIAVFPFKLKRVVPERLAGRFPDLDEPIDAASLNGMKIPGGYAEQLGTLGRGNHFVELARVHDVLDAGHADRLGLATGDTVLIVHSGSRGLGQRILRAHTEEHGAGPAADPVAYLAAHDEAVRWGHLNRRLMAGRVADALGAELGEPVTDVCHNSVEVRSGLDRHGAHADGLYLHRKGAAPGDGQDVLIAGTRGTHSFLVAGHSGAEAGHSVAHGAGRKMSRADALRRGKAKHRVEELRRTSVGSFVVCGDRQLLFEEAPTAYKRIEQVIGDLVSHGLATPIVSTLPLVTYKTAEPAPRSGGRR